MKSTLKESNFNENLTKDILFLLFQHYNQFNVFVVLVEIVIWTEKNEIELSNDNSKLIGNFNSYRNDILLKKYPHDIAQLITKTDFGYGS